MSDGAACWLCGSTFRAPAVDCLDCGLPLLAPGFPPSEQQARVRHLVDEHLDEEEREAVVPALAALADGLAFGEGVTWLTDAVLRRRPGVLAITTKELRWVPADPDELAEVLAFADVVDVIAWPGDGGQLRVGTADEWTIFKEIGSRIWIGQVAEVLQAALGSPEEARAVADRLEALDR